MRIPGISSRRSRSRFELIRRPLRRLRAADLVCLVGWHFWGEWDVPTAAAGKMFQQRVCPHCGRAQVREIG